MGRAPQSVSRPQRRSISARASTTCSMKMRRGFVDAAIGAHQSWRMDGDQWVSEPGAWVELSQFALNVDGRTTPISAGMSVTAEIKTGRRRIIEFLLSPLQRRVEEAGRER